MRRVHRWRAPRWFRILMIVATRGGDGWLWYALGLILVVFGGPHRFAAIGAASTVGSRSGNLHFPQHSNMPAIASVRAKSSRTAGLRFCRRTNILFRRATRSPGLPSERCSTAFFHPELLGTLLTVAGYDRRFAGSFWECTSRATCFAGALYWSVARGRSSLFRASLGSLRGH